MVFNFWCTSFKKYKTVTSLNDNYPKRLIKSLRPIRPVNLEEENLEKIKEIKIFLMDVV